MCVAALKQYSCNFCYMSQLLFCNVPFLTRENHDTVTRNKHCSLCNTNRVDILHLFKQIVTPS